MIRLDVRKDLKALTHRFDDLSKRQIPFATARALTATAKVVQAAEGELLEQTFDTPTLFTRRAVAVQTATKANLTARVFVKDIQAAYLSPYEDGGLQVLGKKRAMLTPVGVGLNQYGNIPRNKLASLKGRPNVFIGPVTFKTGRTVNGVWQRGATPRGERRGPNRYTGGGHGTKGRHHDVAGARTTLKLLVEFTDPKPVTKHLPFNERGLQVARATFRTEFRRAMADALATAR